MSLREYLPTWLGGSERAAGPPIDFEPPFTQWFGPGIANQPSHETLLREERGVSARATRALANRISSLKPLVKVSRRVEDGTLIDEILDDHPLKALIDRPHPDFSRAQLLRLTTQWIVTVGEAYWYKVGNGFRVPTELHPVPPANVKPIVDAGVVVAYNVKDGKGAKRDVPPDLITRFYFPDPESPWTSEGYLGPAAVTADSLRFAGEHLRAHYQSDATPKSYLQPQENADVWTQEQKERFWAMWRKHYHNRLGTDIGVPGIIPTGYQLMSMVVQSGGDLVPLLEFWRDEQLMDYGVPRSILGQVVSGDRSSAEVNQWVFDQYSVMPLTNLIADGITLQLAPDFDASLFVEFEKFVSDDKHFNLEQETADLVGKVRSVNQVREDRGLDPAPWGDEPVGKIGEMPYEPDAIYELSSDEPTALGDEEPEEERKRLVASDRTRAAYFTPDVEWLRQVAREKAYVPSFEKQMRIVFGIQERETVKRLKKAMRVTTPEVFTPEKWGSLFEKRVEPIREKAFQAVMAETLAGLGIEDFSITETMMQVLRHQGALLVQQTNRTTQKLISRQLEAGTAEGESIDQIAKRIRGVFTQRRRNHARTIARTEVLKASQQAQLDSFALAGIERRAWHTSQDAAVRDSHEYADGQIRAVGEPFDLAGEPALAPGIGLGGSQLSAGNSINCRCFLVPVLEG
jgi:SPP1 gp7 family putative phage head morphogenesis protein